MKTLKKKLIAAGIKWRNANGKLKFYFRAGRPQRMPDGSFWNGTETIGIYESWENAANCGWLASHLEA